MIETTASIFQAVGVVGALAWAVYLFQKETYNKRLERTKNLIDSLVSMSAHESRRQFREELSKESLRIAELIRGRIADDVGKRDRIRSKLNDYEVILMMCNKKYYDRHFFLSVFGDCIEIDYNAAENFIREDRRQSAGSVRNANEIYQELEFAARRQPLFFRPSKSKKIQSLLMEI